MFIQSTCAGPVFHCSRGERLRQFAPQLFCAHYSPTSQDQPLTAQPCPTDILRYCHRSKNYRVGKCGWCKPCHLKAALRGVHHCTHIKNHNPHTWEYVGVCKSISRQVNKWWTGTITITPVGSDESKPLAEFLRACFEATFDTGVGSGSKPDFNVRMLGTKTGTSPRREKNKPLSMAELRDAFREDVVERRTDTLSAACTWLVKAPLLKLVPNSGDGVGDRDLVVEVHVKLRLNRKKPHQRKHRLRHNNWCQPHLFVGPRTDTKTKIHPSGFFSVRMLSDSSEGGTNHGRIQMERNLVRCLTHRNFLQRNESHFTSNIEPNVEYVDMLQFANQCQQFLRVDLAARVQRRIWLVEHHEADQTYRFQVGAIVISAHTAFCCVLHVARQ